MTKAVFDFDAIRRRRDAITGNGPSGTVWQGHAHYQSNTQNGDITRVPGEGMLATLEQVGHDWDYGEALFSDSRYCCTRCGWKQSRCDEQDGIWTPPQVCAGKLQWGEACIECGEKTVATFYTSAGVATRCLSPKCRHETWTWNGERGWDKDPLLTRLEANLEAARAAYNLKPCAEAASAWRDADELLRLHRGKNKRAITSLDDFVDAARMMLDSALMAPKPGQFALVKTPNPLRAAEQELGLAQRELREVEADGSWIGQGVGPARVAGERLTAHRAAVERAYDEVHGLKRKAMLDNLPGFLPPSMNALAAFEPVYADFHSDPGADAGQMDAWAT